MAFKLEDKRAVVAEVAEIAAKAYSAVVAEYRGMTVAEITGLRIKAREAGVYLKVVRNTLAKRAVNETEFACLREVLTGPVILGFSQQDPGSAARVFSEFAKTNNKLVLKAAAVGGKLVSAADIEKVAKLPTYNEAISLLMSVMQAPMTKFVRTLAEPHAKLARTIAAIRDQKEKQAA